MISRIILFQLLFPGFLIATGCKKNVESMDTATIVGEDLRTGPCNGGWFIKIDGHPNPNDLQNGYYDIDSAPSSFSLTNLHYPTKVKLAWHSLSKCSGNYVEITKIEAIN